jgi:hypothetical protein
MGFFDKIKDAGGKLGNLKDAGIDKIKTIITDFENALPVLKKAGYNLKELNITVGVPPTVLASFNIKNVSEEVSNAALEELDSNKVGKAVLSALIGASKMKQKIEVKNMTMDEIEVELGLIPKVSIIYTP